MRTRSRRLKELPPRYGSKRPSVESRPLTKREREVVEWIAAGKRNAEIGQILGCSSRTVQKHVQHILEKLHLETRIAVCIWWYEHRIDRDGSAAGGRKSRS